MLVLNEIFVLSLLQSESWCQGDLFILQLNALIHLAN